MITAVSFFPTLRFLELPNTGFPWSLIASCQVSIHTSVQQAHRPFINPRSNPASNPPYLSNHVPLPLSPNTKSSLRLSGTSIDKLSVTFRSLVFTVQTSPYYAGVSISHSQSNQQLRKSRSYRFYLLDSSPGDDPAALPHPSQIADSALDRSNTDLGIPWHLCGYASDPKLPVY